MFNEEVTWSLKVLMYKLNMQLINVLRMCVWTPETAVLSVRKKLIIITMAQKTVNISPRWICKKEFSPYCYIATSLCVFVPPGANQTQILAFQKVSVLDSKTVWPHSPLPSLCHALFLLFQSVSNHLIAPLKQKKKKQNKDFLSCLSSFLSPSLH